MSEPAQAAIGLVFNFDGELFEDFETIGDWTKGTNGTMTADTTNFAEGSQGIKLTGSGGLNVLMSRVINRSFSTESNFVLWVYIDDVTAMQSLYLMFSSSSAYASYFHRTYAAAALVNGWNKLVMEPGDFTASGGESWSNTMIRMRCYVLSAAGKTVNVTFDNCRLSQIVVTPPQSDVVELLCHLGCSKEVSSYEVKLYNWNGKYSPGGSDPLYVGLDGSISLGRTPNMPLLMTVRVEKIKYQSTPTENYVVVSGRCWGEKLFRRTASAIYTGMTGEEIVKDLMDTYASLSHERATVELVEDTDTTYSELEYEDSPVWDILKYIAESSDNSGVIGYDFRVAPDGKFEFFPRLSKTNSTTIEEKIDDNAEYESDISRVRNKIIVYGLADKSYPTSKSSWTRSLTPSEGTWHGSAGTTTVDATGAPDGGACIKLAAVSNYYGSANFDLGTGNLINCELYPILQLMLKVEAVFGGTGNLTLYDNSYRQASKALTITPDNTWRTFETGVGSVYANQWDSVESGFDWTEILTVRITFYFPSSAGTGNFFIHQLYAGGRRYNYTAEDATSQAQFGLREYVEVDEELWSDGECERRAKSLLDYLKDPAEHISLTSTLIDYGTDPILAGDKVHVVLPNEGVDDDFRVESIEYYVSRETAMELTLSLELGKVAPKLADYLYGLRTHTPNVEKLSRTKLGKRGLPIGSGGGGLGSASPVFYSNIEIDKQYPVINLLTSRTLKGVFGHDGANTFLGTYTGDLVLYAYSHVIRPNTDGSDSLGNASFRFDYGYFKSGIKVAGVDTIGSDGRVALAGFERGTSGYVLEAQGAGYYPLYVDPNGRYTPAAHSHANVYPSGGAGTGEVGNTTTYWLTIAGDSIWYNALGEMDMIDDLEAIKRMKRSKNVDSKGVPLIDASTLPEQVKAPNGMLHAGHMMGWALGAIKQLNARVEQLQTELNVIRQGLKVELNKQDDKASEAA